MGGEVPESLHAPLACTKRALDRRTPLYFLFLVANSILEICFNFILDSWGLYSYEAFPHCKEISKILPGEWTHPPYQSERGMIIFPGIIYWKVHNGRFKSGVFYFYFVAAKKFSVDIITFLLGSTQTKSSLGMSKGT